MKKPIQFILTISVLSFVLFSSCSKKQSSETKESTLKVKVATVKEAETKFPIRTSGRLMSKTESKLSFKSGGIIRKIEVDEGMSIKQGRLLASLDLVEIQSHVKQAELALEKAKRDLGRVKNLYEDSVATLENLQDATTGKEIAESNLQIAEFNLKHSQIVAPSIGKILRKLASENEMVGQGTPVFIFAPDEGRMIVKVNLTDREIVKVEEGDSAKLRFDAWPGRVFDASVTQIANAADPYTGTYETELTLGKTNVKLLSGFIAKAEIFPKLKLKFMQIPVEALVDGKGREGYVYILEDQNPVRKKVEIERIENDKLIISGGLNPGEQVVTEGAQYVESNSVLEIVR